MTATTHEAVRDAVRDAGRALGLPDPVTEGFARLLRPCVHLCPYEALPEELRKDARPAARVGGPARIPQGVDVPDYVPHVLTLDCAALPTGVLDVDFPTEGHVAVLTETTDDGASSSMCRRARKPSNATARSGTTTRRAVDPSRSTPYREPPAPAGSTGRTWRKRPTTPRGTRGGPGSWTA
ncbi:hypothetical protein [Streptomyces diastaticus]|uniref:hypothetical protein n=1 Tax=Streptomyces diastaticus TaxID=1956 RepID=UPI003D1790A4